ncbi:MAG: response regulator, partial [Proteobacteria bacterium]
MVMPKILLVDDDALLGRAIALALSDLTRISVAHHFEEGLQKLTEVAPDLLIVDYQLGDQDGLEFITHARREY